MLSLRDDGDSEQSGSGGGFESEGKSSAIGHPRNREMGRSDVYEAADGAADAMRCRGD